MRLVTCNKLQYQVPCFVGCETERRSATYRLGHYLDPFQHSYDVSDLNIFTHTQEHINNYLFILFIYNYIYSNILPSMPSLS
jgi:hypothetical protein